PALRTYWLPVFVLTIVGVGGILYFNCSTSLIQLSVDDHYRGRVLSVYTLMHQGMATFGNLLLGMVATRWGTPWASGGGAEGRDRARRRGLMELPFSFRAVVRPVSRGDGGERLCLQLALQTYFAPDQVMVASPWCSRSRPRRWCSAVRFPSARRMRSHAQWR